MPVKFGHRELTPDGSLITSLVSRSAYQDCAEIVSTYRLFTGRTFTRKMLVSYISLAHMSPKEIEDTLKRMERDNRTLLEKDVVLTLALEPVMSSLRVEKPPELEGFAHYLCIARDIAMSRLY